MQVDNTRVPYPPSEGILWKAGLTRYLKPGALAQFRDASFKRRADFFGSGSGGYKRQRGEVGARSISISGAVNGQETVPEESGGRQIAVQTPEAGHLTQIAIEPVNGQRKKHYAFRFVRKASYDEGDTDMDMAEEDDAGEEAQAEGQERPASYTTMIGSLPTEILVQILCCLRHHDLKFSLLACKRLHEAALIARQMYFNFMTPDHYKRDTRALKPEPAQRAPYLCTAEAAALAAEAAEAAGTGRLVIPPTPRHGPRPVELGPTLMEMRKIANPLFQHTPAGSSSVNMPRQQLSAASTSTDTVTPHQRTGEKASRALSRPPGLPRPPPVAVNRSSETVSAHRMLFTITSEDDLCRAVVNQTL